MTKIFNFCLVGLALCFLETKVVNAELEVKFVSILFRHGDRAPKNGSERYPNDPYLHTEYPPDGAGRLTNIGKKRMFDFGQRLRERYDNFLGKTYTPFDTLAITTDTDRTKMSMALILAGLFPPTEDQKWNANLTWQPVVIHCTPIADDYLLLPQMFPQYKREFKMVEKLPEVRDKLNSYSELMKNLTELTGKPITNLEEVSYIYYTLLIESRLGLELPAWTQDYYSYGPLYNATMFAYELRNYNEKLRRLNGGTLLKNITETMVAVTEGSYKRKMHLFSAHETNIASLMISLGVWTPHIPDYASAVIIELVGDGSDHYVRVFHYLGVPPEFVEKKIPGCRQPCPIKDFRRLLNKAMPTEDEIMCYKTWKQGVTQHKSCQSSASNVAPSLCFLMFSVYFIFMKLSN